MNRIKHTLLASRTPSSAWRLLFALPAILLALCPLARAADYYVDAQAASGGDGTLATPWNSVAQVNAHGAFAAGDRILFKRGSVFTGGSGLLLNGNGVAGNPIIYGAYSGSGDYPGTGPKPQINDTTGSGVRINGTSYIQVQDLSLSRNGALGVQIDHGNFITILRVDVTDNGTNAAINGSFGGNVVIDGCTVTNGKNGGIQFKGTLTDRIHDSIIQNCVVHGTISNDGIVLHNGATFDDQVGANIIIRNNVAHNCQEQGYDITSGTNVLLENNVSYDNQEGAITIGHAASNVTVRYHRSTNEPTANTSRTLTMSGPDVTVEYSTFIGSASQDQILVNVSAGSAGQQPHNVTLRNNVFVWNHTASGTILEVGDHWSGVPLTNENLTIKNNIFTSRTGAVPVIRFSSPNRPLTYASYVIRNNLYDDTPGIVWNNQGTVYANFAAYQTAVDPANAWNEKSGDPLFVNAGAGDFHLLGNTSPAFDAGTSTIFNNEPPMLTQDIDGIPVPQGAAPDMGAFEFGHPGPAAPSNLTAVAISAHQIDLSWSDNANDETSFRLQRKTGAGGVYEETVPATVGANTVTFSDTTGVAGDTTYTYQVRAENAEGNSAWSNEASATTPVADTTPPVITSLTASPDHLWPANHQMVAVTLTATATDDRDPAPVTKILSVTSNESTDGSGDGHTAVDWEITGNLMLNLRAERAGTGTGRLYTVTVQSTDSEGNSSTATVLIPVGHNNDTQPPVVVLTAPSDGALVRGAAVGLAATASDNDSVVAVQFRLDGAVLGVEDSSAPYGLAWDSTGVADGSHTLAAVARDENGNTAISAAVTVQVDNTPPAVALMAPSAGALLTGTSVSVSATATDQVGVAGVQFLLDGAALGAEVTAAPYALDWDTTAAADGSHTLAAVARDTAGNTTTSAGVSVTVDNLPPVVALTAPAAGDTVAGNNVSVTATATDLVGVAGVQFQLDGVNLGVEDTTAPYGVTWDSTAAAQGAHTLVAVARDGAGHTTASDPVSVTVDNSVPTYGPFQMIGNEVVMEAEHATSRTAGTTFGHNWVDVTQTGASGGPVNNAVQSLPNLGQAIAPGPGPVACRADYQINVPAGSAASFYVHLRGRGPTSSDDSVYVSIDGITTPFQQLVLPKVATLGNWVRSAGTLSIPAGLHTLTLWMREDGAIIDKIVVKDNSTLPTGTGPAESPQ